MFIILFAIKLFHYYNQRHKLFKNVLKTEQLIHRICKGTCAPFIGVSPSKTAKKILSFLGKLMNWNKNGSYQMSSAQSREKYWRHTILLLLLQRLSQNRIFLITPFQTMYINMSILNIFIYFIYLIYWYIFIIF